MNFALVGYGRMGRAIEAAAGERGHRLAAIVDPHAKGSGVRRRLDAGALGGVEIAFEFTGGEAAAGNVRALLGAGVSVVCGSTGWDVDRESLGRLAEDSGAGAVIAPNFSVGMNLFYRLVREAGRAYGATALYQPYVVEFHHAAKADAPSGTALRLAAVVQESDPRVERIVAGDPAGPVPEHLVHVVGVRAGAQPGRHTVGFDGTHDEITLTHQSRGRTGFAAGAVLAAEWILRRKGVHDFDAVVSDLLDPGQGGRT